MEVHQQMIKALVPGNQVKKLMDVAVEYIQKKKPELVPHFVKTGGFGVRSTIQGIPWQISPNSTPRADGPGIQRIVSVHQQQEHEDD